MPKFIFSIEDYFSPNLINIRDFVFERNDLSQLFSFEKILFLDFVSIITLSQKLYKNTRKKMYPSKQKILTGVFNSLHLATANKSCCGSLSMQDNKNIKLKKSFRINNQQANIVDDYAK